MSQQVAFVFGLTVGIALTAVIATFWRQKGRL